MKEFNTRESDFSTGYFSVDNLIDNYELSKKLNSVLTSDELFCHFQRIQKSENDLLSNYYLEFFNIVYERMYDTDLFDKGYDLTELARLNTELHKQKSYLLQYYLLKLTEEEFIKSNLNINGFKSLKKVLDSNSGAVLSFYHWGIFQLMIFALIVAFEKPVALFASREATEYQQKVLEIYFPSKKHLFKTLPISFSSIRESINLIKQGYLVCILPELSGWADSIPIKNKKNFMGSSVVTPEGAATLSAYGKVPLFRGYLEISNEKKILIDLKLISPKVELSKENIRENTLNIWNDLEKLCYQKPAMWGGWEIFDRIQGKATEENLSNAYK
ncbi:MULTISPECIES: hypothetical protein [Bacillaceae]|uniref:Lipid A biosynthesis lauroyl acyltransferase n=1 Tax=Evansella alkalicola TaxID=745819 RepID=A0ABS6JXW7_9BACI|nr:MULTISPECIES: hypothetical protein [Bacillaceae]MBU9723235.1 hypothetical protein [Bacillus alkalicola]